jgi:hypothetical protein
MIPIDVVLQVVSVRIGLREHLHSIVHRGAMFLGIQLYFQFLDAQLYSRSTSILIRVTYPGVPVQVDHPGLPVPDVLPGKNPIDLVDLIDLSDPIDRFDLDLLGYNPIRISKGKEAL